MENDQFREGRRVDEHLAATDPADAWQPDTNAGFGRLMERKTASHIQRRRWVMVFAGSVAIAGCLAAFPPARVLAERCVAACVGETSPIRRILWPSSPGRQPAGGREIAPDFTLTDASGAPVRLSDLRGQVVLLNFWATWCPPCKVEIPWFEEFQQTYGNRGLVVLGVSMDEDGWDSVRPYIERQRIGYRMVIGNDEIARLYGGLDAVPTTFLIDRSGHIAITHAGLVPKAVLEKELTDILEEKE